MLKRGSNWLEQMRTAQMSSQVEYQRAGAGAMLCSFFEDTLHWSVSVRWVDKPDVR